MELFSDEWVQRLADEVCNDSEAKRRLRGIDADFQYVVTPVPRRGVHRSYAFGIHFSDRAEAWEGVRPGAAYKVTVGYALFHGALTGSIHVFELLRNRQVSIQGSKAKLLLRRRGIARVLDLARRIPASAAGDFSDVSGSEEIAGGAA